MRMERFAVLFVSVAVGLFITTRANAVGPITFSSADYDNTPNTVTGGPITPVYNQGTGSFRDVIWWSLNNGQPRVGSDDFINQGNSLILVGNSAVPGSGPYTALNFTGPAISGGQSYISIYDTTPGDGAVTKNVFNAALTLKVNVDVLFVKHSVSGGILALYSEGQDGLALLASNGDGGNSDIPKVSLVWQSVGQGTNLVTATLPANSFVAATWYRVSMELTVTGDAWTMNGTFQNHLVGTDPTSGLGSVITNLSYTGSLSDPDTSPRVLTNPGEIGLMAMGNEGISLPDNVGVSFTNLEIVPEPSSIALVGIALGMGILTAVSRRKRT